MRHIELIDELLAIIPLSKTKNVFATIQATPL
jgi:hypothetical protein